MGLYKAGCGFSHVPHAIHASLDAPSKEMANSVTLVCQCACLPPTPSLSTFPLTSISAHSGGVSTLSRDQRIAPPHPFHGGLHCCVFSNTMLITFCTSYFSGGNNNQFSSIGTNQVLSFFFLMGASPKEAHNGYSEHPILLTTPPGP